MRQINGLVAAGIEPTVTLHHYDTPLALDQRYRGFAADDPTQLIRDFVAFAELCFERYGGRVKRWLTINEVSRVRSEDIVQARLTDQFPSSRGFTVPSAPTASSPTIHPKTSSGT